MEVLEPLPEPVAEAPRMWGRTAPGGAAEWAEVRDRLAGSRNLWLTGVDAGRPHSRPVWAVWLPEGLAYSTGSPVLQRAGDGGLMTATTEGGDDPVILEGNSHRVVDRALLERFASTLDEKYDWHASATDQGMVDADGNAGPVFVLRPRLAFSWGRDMAAPTRWRFAYLPPGTDPSATGDVMDDEARAREDRTVYKVVVNHEEQYSIWPADRENARGWSDEGTSGRKEECLAHIREVWTDMRPLSLRKEMEGRG